MTEKLERQLPTGIGGEMLKENREILPAVEVKNEVVWVNPKIEVPFDIREGESTRLGMFLAPNKNKRTGDKRYPLEMKPEHRRSGILGRVIFRDKEGRLYRDVDLKGVGLTHTEFGRQKVQRPRVSFDPAYPDETKTLGILDKPYAENDIQMAEKFLRAGIRTYRPIALIKIEEIIDVDFGTISVKEAKNSGFLKENDDPVVEVRAFGTRARVGDLFGIYNRTHPDDPDTIKLIEDAMKLVAQEQSIDPENFSKEDYLEWFTKTMVANVARMHNKKWIHGYLTSHNVTLDARIVDLDSVETMAEVEKRAKAGEDVRKSSKEDLDDLIFVIIELGRALGIEVQAGIKQFYRNERIKLVSKDLNKIKKDLRKMAAR